MNEDLINAHEAARILGVHPNTIANWRRAGRLSSVRLASGIHRYRLSDVMQMSVTVEARCRKKPVGQFSGMSWYEASR